MIRHPNYNKLECFYNAKPHVFRKAQELRNNMTEAEKILWSVLRRNKLSGYYFRRQHPIDRFIADFYCHSAKLVIEVDGGIHNTSRQKEYDIGRDEEMAKFGIRVLRLKNAQILEDLLNTIRVIEDHLQESETPP